jgi:3-dehydroquinate synthase
MSFFINNNLFSSDLNLSEEMQIKSYNKTYFIEHCNKSLCTLINETYVEGDFIFIDKNVFSIEHNCFDNIEPNYYMIDANEKIKTMETVLYVIDILIKVNFKKPNKMIVIGGGITQDVAGFIASIYKRGMSWTFIPTTLLSMTDSSIGGKVCINREIKNIISLFNAPSKVIISDFFLKTLSEDDIISGVGEAYKIALIGGEETVSQFYKSYETKDYKRIINLSHSVKKTIIEYDEFDNCERKVLNYGHTIGHAIEIASDYLIPHGISVLYGMYLINKIFYINKHSDINNFIIKLIPERFLNFSISYTKLLEAVLNDKKNNGDNICFILLEEIGRTSITYHSFSKISDKLITELNMLFVNSDEKE